MIDPEHVQAILKAPVAERIPPRTEHSWKADDYWHRAAFAPTAELRQMWKARLEGLEGAEVHDSPGPVDAQASDKRPLR